MSKRPILFLDSGIGGLPYCAHFHSRRQSEPLIYVADRQHFPYGSKSRGELEELLCQLMEKLVARFNPRLVALVCNTASVSALDSLRQAFPALPFVGTVPAVKSAVLASRKGHIGVLGTERTIADPYIAELAAQHAPHCAVTGIAAPELVDFVERRLAVSGEAERRERAAFYIEAFRKKGADAVVLGCTHFLFLLDEFKHAACGGAAASETAAANSAVYDTAEPGMTVHDSLEGVSRRLESLLDGEAGSSGGEQTAADSGQTESGGLLLVTGGVPQDEGWRALAESFAAKIGLSLRSMEEF